MTALATWLSRKPTDRQCAASCEIARPAWNTLQRCFIAQRVDINLSAGLVRGVWTPVIAPSFYTTPATALAPLLFAPSDHKQRQTICLSTSPSFPLFKSESFASLKHFPLPSSPSTVHEDGGSVLPFDDLRFRPVCQAKDRCRLLHSRQQRSGKSLV